MEGETATVNAMAMETMWRWSSERRVSPVKAVGLTRRTRRANVARITVLMDNADCFSDCSVAPFCTLLLAIAAHPLPPSLPPSEWPLPSPPAQFSPC